MFNYVYILVLFFFVSLSSAVVEEASGTAQYVLRTPLSSFPSFPHSPTPPLFLLLTPPSPPVFLSHRSLRCFCLCVTLRPHPPSLLLLLLPFFLWLSVCGCAPLCVLGGPLFRARISFLPHRRYGRGCVGAAHASRSFTCPVGNVECVKPVRRALTRARGVEADSLVSST